MRLAIGVTLAALLGCDSDDAGGVFITASWTFRSVTSNTPQLCPPGFPNVVLHARGTPCVGGECLFDLDGGCDPDTPVIHSDVSGGLEPAVYEVWLDFVSADGASTFTSTTPETLDLTLGDKTYARQILLDGGVFKIAWTLRTSNGTERTCEEAGVFGIHVSASPVDDPSTANNDELDCEGGFGYTYEYGVGAYTVNLEAVNDSGQTMGLAQPLMDKVIVAPNGVTDLGTIDIELSDNPGP